MISLINSCLLQYCMERCSWCGTDPLYQAYHDEEWGVPCHDDRKLFEFIILEGAQAGLSWITILRKRENYRAAFAGFDPAKVARFTDADVQRLLANEGIVRNRLKIASAIRNANVFLAIQQEFGSFDTYLWQYVQGKPVVHNLKSGEKLPATTPLSDAISKDLKKRGMNFVGSTIIYGYLQAMGVVNDHRRPCFKAKN